MIEINSEILTFVFLKDYKLAIDLKISKITFNYYDFDTECLEINWKKLFYWN